METDKENFTEGDEIWVELEKLSNPSDFPYIRVTIL